jgi:hypothetical protein
MPLTAHQTINSETAFVYLLCVTNSTVFLGKLTVTQLVKKFPSFYVTKGSLLCPQELSPGPFPIKLTNRLNDHQPTNQPTNHPLSYLLIKQVTCMNYTVPHCVMSSSLNFIPLGRNILLSSLFPKSYTSCSPQSKWPCFIARQKNPMVSTPETT